MEELVLMKLIPPKL